MSWSASFVIEPQSYDIDAIVQAALEDHIFQDEGSRDQAAEAYAAAAIVIKSGALGDANEYAFRVSLAGHTNPGHAPVEGWSHDCVTISISQVARQGE